MKITRNIVIDLWPVYQSGEASQDTRDLVEAYLADEPEFTNMINAQQEQEFKLTQAPIELPKEIEMETLEKTKKILWQRSLYTGLAIFFTLFAFTFNFDTKGVHWIWEGMPVVSGICLAVGIFFWAKLAHTTGKLKGSNL